MLTAAAAAAAAALAAAAAARSNSGSRSAAEAAATEAEDATAAADAAAAVVPFLVICIWWCFQNTYVFLPLTASIVCNLFCCPKMDMFFMIVYTTCNQITMAS